jgi:hypothetical protein
LEIVAKELIIATTQASHENELRMKQLQHQLTELTTNVFEISDNNHETELKYRRDKNKADIALSDKMQEYQKQMTIRENELQRIVSQYSKDLEEYEELKQHYDIVDAALAKQAHENNLIQQIKDWDNRAMNKLHKAAAVIQKIFRGRKCRKDIKKVKSKKSKNGGKKKKR